ncbi:carbamoyl-phosphate synthase [Bacillus mycoides]|uniref:carbamoyl-phosphate synthase n=1 Tax=Bacillus mycoides TaxID=1405 RepID=UPI0035575BA0
MADGQVQIQTRLDSSNIRRDVEQTNRELSRVGSNMGSTAREMRNTFGSEFTQMNRDITRGYTQVSQAHMDMMNEMKNASHQQKAGMQGIREAQIEAQYGYFQLAQSQGQYTGSMGDLLANINEIGKAQKKANDQQINGNKMAMMSMYQTIGYLNSASTSASRAQKNLTTMNNPLYNTSRLALTALDSIEKIANTGSPQQLALEFLGANASVKEYNDFMRDLGAQLMALPVVFGIAAAGAAKFYGALHGRAMEENTKYAEAYKNMIEKLAKAFEPMVQAFASVMTPIYNFIARMAELVIQFNEAHPTLAKFIQGMMMLVPALMVVLTPLALGIGYFKGLRAILFAVKPILMPIAKGFAFMSGPAWLIAAAIAGVVVGFKHFYTTSETFRNAIDGCIGAVKNFGSNIISLGKYLFWTSVDGDHLNDWLSHLPESWRGAAEAVGGFVSKIHGSISSMFGVIIQFGSDLMQLGSYLTHVAITGDSFADVISKLPPSVQGLANAIAPALVAVNSFGQAILASGKYFFWAAADGDYYNDWLSHLPASWQNVALAVGTFLSSMNASLTATFGPLTQLGTAFSNLGNYLLSVVSTGNLMNGWLNMMPVGFQTAGVLIGNAILIIKTAISSLVEAIRLAMGGDASQLGQIFATILPSLITMLIGGLPALLITAMRFLPTIVEGINTMMPGLTSTITNVITSMVNMIVTYLPQFLQQGIGILTKVIEGIVQVLPQVITTLVDVATQMINSFVNIIGTLLPVILDAGIKILMAVIDGIVKSLPQIIDAGIKVMNTLIESIVKILPQIIDAGIKILMALIDGIVKILPNLIDTAIMLVTKICDMIMQNLPKLLDAGIKILMAIIDGIIKILPSLIEAGIKIIVKLVEILIQNLPKLIDAGVKILTALIEGIIKILPKLIETGLKLIVEIAKTIISNLPQILSAGVQILKMLIEGIVSMVGSLLSTIGKEVIGGITKSFSDAGKWLVTAGKNIITGLTNGITSKIDDAVNSVKKVGGRIKDAVTGFFDIHSPSRLMYGMGEFVTEGLANGIVSLSSYAVKETERMANAIIGAFDELGDDIALGGFVTGSMPDIASLTSGSIKLPPSMKQATVTGAETVVTKKNASQDSTGAGSTGDTYIIMDKKLVGEAVAESVDASNKRKASRLAQFNPTVVPAL